MYLSDAIKMYLADRQARGLAANTVRAEKRTLSLLLSDVGNISTKSLHPRHVDVFWANRDTWGPGTMNLGRVHLTTFFVWCQRRGYISRDVDLLGDQKNLRVPKRHRVIIPQSEFSTFLDTARTPRIRASLALGLYLFVRISEISQLRWQDVDFKEGVVHVYRQKTRTLDTLPLCKELERELRRWKLEYAAKVGSEVQPAWYLIPGMTKGAAKGRTGSKGFVYTEAPQLEPGRRGRLNDVMAEALQRAGYYQKGEGGHTLRRSGAIALYNQLTHMGHDRSIRVCQAMLGHSSIQTTEIYLRLDLDRKVRNDLLAGKAMFPDEVEAEVVTLEAVRSE